MRYQAILFDLDGTLLPMHEKTFVDCFYSALVKYMAPTTGATSEMIAQILGESLNYVIQNDGNCTNRQAFINYYEQYYQRYGIRINIDEIESFYSTVFDEQVRSSCGCDPAASRVVNYIKQANTPMIVATNPFFPSTATHARIRWAGLDPKDFCEITVYDTSHYCKPNIAYYQELFERTGYDPKRCLMVGNSVDEDMIASALGCDVYLVLRNMINKNHADISALPQGSLDDLISFLQ